MATYGADAAVGEQIPHSEPVELARFFPAGPQHGLTDLWGAETLPLAVTCSLVHGTDSALIMM
jgi:hypothetical protein